MTVCFFFSSRRRHTRWTGDWSSDVCSSDLWRQCKQADQMQADRGIAGIPVGVDGAGLERQDFCFWKGSPADVAALLRVRGWMILPCPSNIPVVRAIHQLVQRQACCIPVGLFTSNDSIEIKYYKVIH